MYQERALLYSSQVMRPTSVLHVQIEALRPLTVSILSERRAVPPPGLEAGGAAQRGINLLLRRDGRTVSLGGKATVELRGGERLRILTPGAVPNYLMAYRGFARKVADWRQAGLVQVAAALGQRVEMPAATEQRRLQTTSGTSCAQAAAWPSTDLIRSLLDGPALLRFWCLNKGVGQPRVRVQMHAACARTSAMPHAAAGLLL